MSVAVQNTWIDRILSSAVKKDAYYELRAKARDTFSRLGLPHSKTEEYKYTPLTRQLEKVFESIKPSAKSSITSIEKFRIPNLEAHELVFIDGVFSESLSNFSTTNLEIKNLHQLDHAEVGKLTGETSDPFVAWNTAFFTDGVLIVVKENSRINKPVVFYHISESGAVAINRNVVVVGKDAEVSIIEKFDGASQNIFFANLVNEIHVQENARLYYSCIQYNPAGIQFNHTAIHQATRSHVNCFTITLDGKLIRNNLHLTLDGEGCDSHMYGLYLLTNETLADNHTTVDHQKPNSESNELYKGVMNASSKGVFNGKIYVRPHAQKTNAFQSNRNIILSDKATVNTKPQLEIWADDVKCSHGCTSGQLDEEALFYLQARGLPKEKAQALLLDAFAGEVVEKIENDTLRKFVEDLVDIQLHERF
jgi:Fe-S cluster assembly protein SufD